MNDPYAIADITKLWVRHHAAKSIGAEATAAQAKAQMDATVKFHQREGNLPDPEGLTSDVTSQVIKKYSQHLPALLGDEE